jgi:hypothetical protein
VTYSRFTVIADLAVPAWVLLFPRCGCRLRRRCLGVGGGGPDPHVAAPSSPILPSVQQHPPTCYQICTSSMVRSADPCGLRASVDQPALVARERDRTGFDASAWHADSAAARARAPAARRPCAGVHRRYIYMPTRSDYYARSSRDSYTLQPAVRSLLYGMIYNRNQNWT